MLRDAPSYPGSPEACFTNKPGNVPYSVLVILATGVLYSTVPLTEEVAVTEVDFSTVINGSGSAAFLAPLTGNLIIVVSVTGRPSWAFNAWANKVASNQPVILYRFNFFISLRS